MKIKQEQWQRFLDTDSFIEKYNLNEVIGDRVYELICETYTGYGHQVVCCWFPDAADGQMGSAESAINGELLNVHVANADGHEWTETIPIHMLWEDEEDEQ